MVVEGGSRVLGRPGHPRYYYYYVVVVAATHALALLRWATIDGETKIC